MGAGINEVQLALHQATHSMADAACELIGPGSQISELSVKFHPEYHADGTTRSGFKPATFEIYFRVFPEKRRSDREERAFCRTWRASVLRAIRELTNQQPSLSLRQLHVQWHGTVSMQTSIEFEVTSTGSPT